MKLDKSKVYKMTAETLKPFLTVTTNGGEVRQRKMRNFFIIFTLISLLIIFAAGLLTMMIWQSVRITELEKEVTDLRTKVTELRKHLQFDLFEDDLNNLDDLAYKKSRQDANGDDDTIYLDGNYDKEAAYGREKSAKGDDDDDDEDGGFLDDDFDGSGDYEDYEDEYSDANIYDDVKKFQQRQRRSNRNRRALAGLTHQGVPIMEESYIKHRRNHTKEQHENSVHSPRLQYNWDDYRNIRRRPHPRANHLPHHNQPDHPRSGHHLNTIENNEIHDSVPLLDRLGHHRGFAQESLRPPTEYARAPKAGHGKKFLHLVRDPRELGDRGHKTKGGVIYNDWISKDGTVPKDFKVDAGVVTIQHPGHYYVYAQISNSGAPESFVIERNQNAELSCSTSDDTCFTAGIISFRANDMLYVKDLSSLRSRIKQPHQTYFGLIKLD